MVVLVEFWWRSGGVFTRVLTHYCQPASPEFYWHGIGFHQSSTAMLPAAPECYRHGIGFHQSPTGSALASPEFYWKFIVPLAFHCKTASRTGVLAEFHQFPPEFYCNAASKHHQRSSEISSVSTRVLLEVHCGNVRVSAGPLLWRRPAESSLPEGVTNVVVSRS